MKNKELWQDLIDRYMKNKLQGDELMAFEKALKNDPEFAKEFSTQKDLALGVRTLGNRDLKEQLKQIHKETIEQQPATKKKTRTIALWKILSAAAAAILLGFFIFQTMATPNLNPNELYAAYYQPVDLNLQSRAGDANVQLVTATTLYDNKKYLEALPMFQTLLAVDPTNTQLQLATGICQLELNHADQAIPHFQKILELKDPFLSDHATWYLALTYLKMDNFEAAKKQLQQLTSDPGADHFKEAKDLIEQLD